MGAKRAAQKDGAEEKGPAKKGRTSAGKGGAEKAKHNPNWKSRKPSIIYLGDDSEPSDKVAAFDLDGTIIDWKPDMDFQLTPDSWVWFNDSVPAKLKELQGDGYKLVIFTNQALIKSALEGKAASNFKAKVDSVLAAAGVEAVVLAATMKDENRKPETGLWEAFLAECNADTEVDEAASFFVGDAAGRDEDHSSDDKSFAEAIALPFKTPEEVFGPSRYPNKSMAACLRKVAEEVLESGDSKAHFRASALKKAAKSIGTHMEVITSSKEAVKLPGVGKGTGALVDNFLKFGHMQMEGEGEGGKEKGSKADGDKPAAASKTKPSPKKKGKKDAGDDAAALAFL